MRRCLIHCTYHLLLSTHQRLYLDFSRARMDNQQIPWDNTYQETIPYTYLGMIYHLHLSNILLVHNILYQLQKINQGDYGSRDMQPSSISTRRNWVVIEGELIFDPFWSCTIEVYAIIFFKFRNNFESKKLYV